MVYDLRQAKVVDAGPAAPEQLADRGLPKYVRLEIPLADPFWFRVVADELRALAMRLDLLSRENQLTPLQIAMCALFDVRSANQKISAPTRSGRSG